MWKSAQSLVRLWILAFALLAIVLSACGSTRPEISTTTPPQQPISSASVLPTVTKIALPTSTTRSEPLINAETLLYVPSYVPQSLVQRLKLPESIKLTDKEEGASLTLKISNSKSMLNWVYALVAPFPTTSRGVSSQNLQAVWKGTREAKSAAPLLLMEQDTYDLFTAWWGKPAQHAVLVLPESELLDYAWENQPAWALIPFEAIEPRWRVLEVDGESPISNGFNQAAYPLAVPFTLVDGMGLELATLPDNFLLPGSNRDASKLTVVALTGVTALVRGTALWMERYGVTYPSQKVREVLQQADITHISNEIPFVPECPFPTLATPVPEGQPLPTISFCSRPEYFAVLQDVGADVVELTGDHFADWGAEAMEFTLALYEEHKLPVYGGGANIDKARQPLLLEHNGNKLAFLGCNIGWPVRSDQIPSTALAGPEHPGAASCDFEWLAQEIPSLRAQDYQVIFTFQHREYYRMKAEAILVDDFASIAEYGATIVSGSQAHQPHSMAFDGNTFLHYGLGNLFFDQYHFCADFACDYGFIDLHSFYDGRYLGVNLIPIRFVDLAQPRLMTDAEQEEYLALIFAASGWTIEP